MFQSVVNRGLPSRSLRPQCQYRLCSSSFVLTGRSSQQYRSTDGLGMVQVSPWFVTSIIETLNGYWQESIYITFYFSDRIRTTSNTMTIIIGAVVIERLCRSSLKSAEDPIPDEKPTPDPEVNVQEGNGISSTKI